MKKLMIDSVTLITILCIVILSLISFDCGRIYGKRNPSKYSYLPLNEISDVSIVDDNVIIIVLQDGNHYALQADGE